MNPPAGHHLGFAAHHSFRTDVAEIAEVSVEDGKIRVHKVTCVLDCGQAVNPDIVRSQMEGGVIYGLTAALYGGLSLEGGAIKESNFHDYPCCAWMIARDRGHYYRQWHQAHGCRRAGSAAHRAGGSHAVFKATGQRLRSLPLQLA